VTFSLGVTILRSRIAVTININQRTSTSPRDSRPYVKIILNRGNNGIRWPHHPGFGGVRECSDIRFTSQVNWRPARDSLIRGINSLFRCVFATRVHIAAEILPSGLIVICSIFIFAAASLASQCAFSAAPRS
jgi:hypothetical protein